VEYDVVIVGAGPAGSTAARACAKGGLRTLLLEKEALPRHKVCGGGLTEKTLSLLDFDVGDVIEGECYGVRFCYGSTHVDVETPFKIISFTSRDRFDALLAQEAVSAGAELADSEKVESITVGKRSAHIRTSCCEYDANVVVGADGIESVVAPHVRDKLHAHEVFLSLEAEVPKEHANSEEFSIARAYFDRVPYGYGWVFPKKDVLSVGVCCRLSSFRDPGGVFRDFMVTLGLDENTRFGAHMIPFGGFSRSTVADRLILVGDAAGFADPLTGEGIFYAIKSGKMAADAVSRACERGEFSKAALHSYEVACSRSFGSDLNLALKLSRRIYGMRETIGRNLSGGGPLLSKALEVYANRITYGEFMKYLLPKVPQYSLLMARDGLHSLGRASL
jgi:geranylgeranyl reductase family protein